jgi:hypothetical protein
MAKPKNRPIKLVFEDRYPLHRGPFLFSPQFLTVADWFQNFSSLIEKVFLDIGVSADFIRGYGNRSAVIKFSNCEMTVDGEGGLFSIDDLGFSDRLRLPGNDDFLEGWSGPGGAPDQFFRDLGDRRYVSHLGANYKNVSKFSSMSVVRIFETTGCVS